MFANGHVERTTFQALRRAALVNYGHVKGCNVRCNKTIRPSRSPLVCPECHMLLKSKYGAPISTLLHCLLHTRTLRICRHPCAYQHYTIPAYCMLHSLFGRLRSCKNLPPQAYLSPVPAFPRLRYSYFTAPRLAPPHSPPTHLSSSIYAFPSPRPSIPDCPPPAARRSNVSSSSLPYRSTNASYAEDATSRVVRSAVPSVRRTSDSRRADSCVCSSEPGSTLGRVVCGGVEWVRAESSTSQ